MNDPISRAIEKVLPDDMKAPSKEEPKIILPGDGGISITKSAEKIFELLAKRKDVFLRGGRIVELIEEDGKAHFEIVTATRFCNIVERLGRLFSVKMWRGNASYEISICRKDTAEKLMANDAKNLLPKLRRITTCPILVNGKDGPGILNTGYWKRGGGVYVNAGDEEIPHIPLEKAVGLLKSLLAEFAFATPEDKARALAALIAPALKMGGWLSGHTPVNICEADKNQSGKTYLHRCIHAVYGERCSLIAQRIGGVGSLDEDIAQALINGRPFILLDNFRGRIDSQYLEAIITADEMVCARVPHRGQISVYAPDFMFFLTSNEAEATPDFVNRSLIVRIRNRKDFVFKKFPEGDLLDHIWARKSKYLGAVLSVVEAWALKGCPATDETRHSFRDCIGKLDWIVQNILGETPLLDGHQAAQERVSNTALSFIRSVSLAVEKAGKLGTALTASDIAELCDASDVAIPGLEKGATEDSRPKRVGILMAQAFKNGSKINVDQMEVERRQDKKYNEKRQGNSPSKTYIFRSKGKLEEAKAK